MSAIQRQRVVWTGFPGGPGLSTYYFTDAAASQAALRSFLVAMSSILPDDVTMTIEPGGDLIEETTGVLTGVWAGTIQAGVVGTAVGQTYAAPAGLIVRWETLAIRAGSRLRGRTFFVPVNLSSYQSDGSLNPLTLTGVSTAASDFVGAVTPNLLVWQRPRTATVAYTDGRGIPHKALTGRPGSSAVVVSSSVPDRVAVLRSRRD